MSFVRGKPSANPAGRPSSQWAEISYWFRIVMQESKTLTPLQRVDIAKWAMEFLVENTKVIPQKKSTQEQATDLLKSLEASQVHSKAE